jgi:hypothetical protein
MRTAAYAENSLAHEAPREDAVEQALRILKTSNISWNHPGLAAFDFRSEHFRVIKPSLVNLV